MRRTSLIFLLLAALLMPDAAARGQDAKAQVKAEIQRVQKSLKDNPVSDPNLAGLSSGISKTLEEATQALAAGRLSLSLEKLELAEDLALGMRMAADKEEVVKQGLPAFESRWGKASLTLTALEERSRNKDWNHSPEVVHALWEAAQGSATPLLDGGRGFATATNPVDGLFNVGQAMGEAEFANFAASLNLPRSKDALPLRSILPELTALQAKTNAAFRPPKSIDLHSRFIAINSALKVAQELDARKFYAGALYEYLDAVLLYGMLNGTPIDTVESQRLKAALEAARNQLEKSSNDDSIAQLFLERGEAIALRGDGSAPSAEEWTGVKVFLEEVLPAYSAARSSAAPGQVVPSGKTVALTLVRWPYT
jgi:hypothetical protein